MVTLNWVWPSWRHLPREARDTLFLLAVVAWTVLPHTAHLPIWCSVLTAIMLLWRGTLAVRSTALPGRGVLVFALVAAVALTWLTHRTLLGKEAGVTLLVVLVALKTLELRARRDAFAIFFLGFFLVLTHFLYSQSIAIAAAMIVSVWGLLAAVVLAHMPVGQPSLAQAAGLAGRFALLGAPVMVLLFVLFPRVAPLWGMPRDAGASTGLSGTMRMGMLAELALDTSIAMRVRVVSGTLPAPEALYFRGPVLSHFDGQTWRIAPQPARTAPGGTEPARLQVQGDPVEMEVTLEPLRLSTVPALEATPELPPLEGLRATRRDDLHWVTDRPIAERLRYTARAWPRFLHGPTEADARLAEDLELPSGFNPRTVAWAQAQRLAAGPGPTDANALAAALLGRIRTEGYSYTLTPGTYDDDETGDAIDEFWFDRKAGFCEHFAAAFVVSMRAAGVPARVVTGYQGAERNPLDDTLVVRQSFAHAWAEYWQAGVGWRRADPTQAVAPDRIERGRALALQPGFVASAFEGMAPNALLRLRAMWEATDHRWNQWVLNYSKGAQADLLERMGMRRPTWQDLLLLLLGIGSGLALVGAAWAWWDNRRSDPWLGAYARVRRAAARHGVAAGEAVAPRALAAALQARLGEAAQAAVAALHALDALRYAPHPRPLGRRTLAIQARRLARAAVRALRETPPLALPAPRAASQATLPSLLQPDPPPNTA